MFELLTEVPWPKSLCLFFARLLCQLEWKSIGDIVLGSFLAVVVFLLFFLFCDVRFDSGSSSEVLVCTVVISAVSAFVYECVCTWICFTFCEVMDDCIGSKIVHECGYYLSCIISAVFLAHSVFLKESKGGLNSLVAAWNCAKLVAFPKDEQRCHLLCSCTYRI